jgi:hypothetical protein
MFTAMAKRIRLIIDTDEVLRETVKLAALVEAAKRRCEVTKSDIINELVRKAYPDLLAEAEAKFGPALPPEELKPKKRGRKKKGADE